MAEKNPRDRGVTTVITVSPNAADFLRRTFGMVLDGIRADLSSYGHKVEDALRLHREEVAYRALLKALDSRSLVVTGDICHVLRELADSIDRANEYARVVAEHTALLDLRQQIGGA
jgi:hypothetical protein